MPRHSPRQAPRPLRRRSLMVLLGVSITALLSGALSSGSSFSGVAATSSPYRDAVMADAPRAYWRLGEASGSSAADETGANPGTYMGGIGLGQPSPLLGDPNTAVSLDGIDDYVIAPDSSSLDATGAVTLEAWARRTKAGVFQVILGKPGNGASRFENYALWFNSNNQAVAYFGDGVNYARTVAAGTIDTAWHHIAATYDNATARIYVDGALKASASSTVQLTPNTQPLNLGRANNNAYFLGGGIDEAAVFGTALSAERIKAHYDAGTASSDGTPPAVALSRPVDGSRTNDTTPSFAGSAGGAAGDLAAVSVKVWAGAAASGAPLQTLSATRQADGSYSVDASDALPAGTYTARAEQADEAGNLGLSSANTFVVDTAAPSLTLTTPADGSATNDTTPSFSGSAGSAAGDKPTVSVKVWSGGAASGTPLQTLSATRQADGSYSVDAAALGEGTYTARAEQEDVAGNTGLSSTSTFTVTAADLTPPTVTLTAPADGSATNDTTPSFRGSAGTGPGDHATVSVKVWSGASASGTPLHTFSATRQANGSYSVDASEALPAGTYTARAEQADDSGNVGRSAARTFTIDTTEPKPTLTTPADGSATNDTTPTFGGIAGTAPGDDAKVSVKLWSGTSAAGTPLQTLSATRQADGSYSVDASALGEGTYTARAEQDDTAGNTGVSPSTTFTVTTADVTPPTVTLTAPAEGSATNDTTPSFSGRAGGAAGDQGTVTVKIWAGANTTGTPLQTLSATRQADGSYSIEPLTPLFQGTYTAQAEQADDAGNIGRSAARTFLVDTTAPSATITASPPNPSNSRSASFSFASSEAGAFRCSLDGAAATPCTSPVTYGGVGDGNHSFAVTAVDAAGNESSAATYNWFVDATAPALTLTAPASGSTTGDSTPTLSGSAGTAAGDATIVTVKLWSGGGTGGTPSQTLSAARQADGSYSVDAASLVDGIYTARAEQADSAGNVGSSSANTFQVATEGGYRNQVLADAPSAYWRLGEGSGTTAADETGANPGSYNGGVTLGQPGALVTDANKAASLDGTNDYVSAPDSNSLDATSAVTVEAWIKRTKSGAQVIAAKPGNGQSKLENYGLWLNSSNQPIAYFGNGSTYARVVSSTALDTSWHHIATSYDNATAKLYVDGVLKASAGSTVQLTPNSEPLNIGRTSNGKNYFGGSIDEVAVYRTALSAARIKSHYDAGLGNDGAAPIVTLSSPPNGAATSDPTPTFSGTAGAAAGDAATVTVKVYSGTSATGTPVQVLTAPRQLDGSYTVEATPVLSNGTYTAQAEQADSSGNIGRSAANTFSVDTAAPVVTLSTPANGSLVNPPPTMSGAAGTAAGDQSTVTVKVYSGSGATGTPVQTLAASRQADGTYSVEPSPALADGTYTARAEQADAAGNVGLSPANTFTVTSEDVTAPVVSLTTPANGSRSSDTTPTFGGSAGTAAGDQATVTVKVYSGTGATGTPVRTLSATREANGSYSVEPLLAFGEGTYTAQAEQADDAGNLGRSSATTFVIDLTAPAVTLSSPADGSTSGDATPTLSGTGGTSPGDSATVTVRVYGGASATGTPLQTRSASVSGGNWSVTATALAPGTYTARAQQDDSAGNSGLSSANTFTVTEQAVEMLAAGDIARCGTGGDEQTAALLDQHPDALVVPLGDLVYDWGSTANYQCYNDSWGRAKSRSRPVIGGHDYGQSGTDASAYYSYWQNVLAPFGAAATDQNRGYYSYEHGSWHIVVANATACIDNLSTCDMELQEQWVRNELRSHASDCTLVYWHDPRFSSGVVHGPSTNAQGLWAIAYEEGADLVVNASEHIYERFARMDSAGNLDAQHGVRQITVGTGGETPLYGLSTPLPGTEVRNNDTLGVLKLRLSPGSYEWKFLPVAGRTFTDQGSEACHDAPPGPPAAVPSVRSSSSAVANHPSNSITIDKPAGTAAGDVLTAIVAHQSGTSTNLAPPAGWTAVANTDHTDGNNTRIRAWYKIAGAVEPSSYTFSLSGSGQALGGGIMAISGARTPAPIDVSAGQVTSTNVRTLPAPSITTTVPNTLLVYGGSVNSPQSFYAPGMMSERWDRRTSGTYNVATEVATQPFVGPGATGTRSAFLSESGRGPAILMAIAPR